MLIQKFNYQKINRENLNGKRYYVNPLGQKLPSVTTILEQTKPEEARKALNEWRRRVGEERAKEISTQASGRGTRLHKWLENFVQNGSLGEPGTNPYSQQSHLMARSIIDNGFSRINEIWGNEVGVYYPELYAGTTDCVGVHEGKETVFDFKQANKPKRKDWIEDYFLQVVAYALAHNEVHNTNIQKGVIMISVLKEGSTVPEYQEFVIENQDFENYVSIWCDRVSQFYKTAKY